MLQQSAHDLGDPHSCLFTNVGIVRSLCLRTDSMAIAHVAARPPNQAAAEKTAFRNGQVIARRQIVESHS